jgi:ABC-2 type transport system ATP-binding protein
MSAITVHGLTKRFGTGDGAVVAVDNLTFTLEHGTVTGFLGPNGAGKTTTLRMLLGLVQPTAGEALIGGRPYRKITDPSREVGAVLEASSFHPGRRARDHLLVLATSAGLPASRVDQARQEVDLADAARRRVGGFSLGMR